MPTENNGSTGDTQDQEQQDQQQDTTPDTGGNGDQQQVNTPEKPTQLPDDHPLVKQLATNKDKIARLNAELTEARAKSAAATKLEEELAARPSVEAMETLQTRYDRLEAFLQAAGGPLGKALDSRSFTRELFETDKDIATLVKEWHRANPSATSTALGSAAAEPASKKIDANALIRAAAGK
jgi:hypothetical protein